MDCHHCLDLMSQSLDGPLPPQLQSQLEEHLNTCPSCAQLYRELRAQSQALRELDCPFPDGLHQRILDQLPSRRPEVGRARRIHLRRWGALAACAVLAVALGVARPWDRSDPGLQPASAGQTSPYALSPSHTPNQGDPRYQAPQADTILRVDRLPQGWESVVPGVASPDGAILTGEEALAFRSLLDQQGIPYTLEGDPTLSGQCQLIVSEG